MQGYFETDNLSNLIEITAKNIKLIYRFSGILDFSAINFLKNKIIKNTKKRSKENIAKHYDLGNDFFSMWLDETLTYSSAIFANDEQTLSEAQNNKYQKLIKKTDIKSAERILEIGCGWGAFSIKLAQETNAKITAITISKQQYEYTKELINYHNLKNRIDLILEDYREINGKFDRIVAIEMLEAVGHEGLSVFFNKCNQLLNHNGSIVLQVITMPENRYDNYRKNVDFIQKYVFLILQVDRMIKK
mgnify:CR=1 FL=1